MSRRSNVTPALRFRAGPLWSAGHLVAVASRGTGGKAEVTWQKDSTDAEANAEAIEHYYMAEETGAKGRLDVGGRNVPGSCFGFS